MSFYHVTFRPYNTCYISQKGHIYPNRKSPFPHLEIHCKVQKWPQWQNVVSSTISWRNWSLQLNILEDIKQKLIQQLFGISPKIFTAKLQFLHNTVAHISFFLSCHGQTLQYMLNKSKKVTFIQTENLHFPIWKSIVRSKNDHNDRMQSPLPYHEGTKVYNWISWKI